MKRHLVILATLAMLALPALVEAPRDAQPAQATTKMYWVGTTSIDEKTLQEIFQSAPYRNE